MRHIGPIRLHAGGPEVWKLASVHLSNRGSIGVKPKGAGVLVGCVCWFRNRGSTGTRPVGAEALIVPESSRHSPSDVLRFTTASNRSSSLRE